LDFAVRGSPVEELRVMTRDRLAKYAHVIKEMGIANEWTASHSIWLPPAPGNACIVIRSGSDVFTQGWPIDSMVAVNQPNFETADLALAWNLVVISVVPAVGTHNRPRSA
jgi:hypothetical protein